MKIVIATGIYPPEIGGPATYSKYLYDNLKKQGHEVVVVTYAPQLKERMPEEAHVHAISRRYPKGLRHILYAVTVFFASRRADVIYAQDAVSAGLPAFLVAKFKRIPFVLKIVGDHAWEHGYRTGKVTVLLDEFLEQSHGGYICILNKTKTFVSRHAKHIIVPSNYLKNIVMKWGVHEDHIHVVPNAAEGALFVPRQEARRKKVFVSVGRLVPWKGFSMLIRLMKEFPEYTLRIVGGGPLWGSLEKEIKDMELEDRIKLFGPIDKKYFEDVLGEATLFLLNTAYEGFSHQLLEIMAHGIPVITTDAGGNKEIVKDNENCMVAKYNDVSSWKNAIEKVLEDSTLYKTLEENGTRTARRYTVEDMITGTLKVLKQS